MADISTSKETLGVYSCPAGDFGVHVSEKMAKGKLWVKQLRRNRCPPVDAWMGFRYALWPSITYGFLAAITPDIDALNKSIQELVRNVLSPLQVNKYIRTFYRVAPKRFQGLGIPNPLIVMLSQKLHLLQTQFNQSSLQVGCCSKV
jgi:glucose-6-phosphate isomerase